MREDLFQELQPSWLLDEGQEKSFVLSTRVRFSRNLKSVFFPNKMDTSAREHFLTEAASKAEDKLSDKIRWNTFGKLSATQKKLVTERRLLNPSQVLDHAQIIGVEKSENAAFLTPVADHYQFIGWAGGWNWPFALQRAAGLWELWRPFGHWAWHNTYGWLGGDPKELGSACRLSIQVHLPGMEVAGDIIEAVELAEEYQLGFRGFSGGGDKSRGSLYQIGTGPSTGRSVTELAGDMNDFLVRLESLEASARASWKTKAPLLLADELGRSLGILTYARVITEEEALGHLSHLRLGAIMGILKGVRVTEINRLYYGVQRGHLALWANQNGYSGSDWDVLRARYVSETVKEGKIHDV